MPRIEINSAKFSYKESGRGQPVVLLHSSASSGAQWQALRERLETRYRVLAPDLYGYGATDPWSGHRPLTIADEAALVEELILRCPEPVHLVGHSYGAAVALRVALHRPGRLRSLTLIEPVAFNLLRTGDAADRELLGEIGEIGAAVCEAAAIGDSWDGMARFVDYWNGDGAWSRIRFETRAALGRCTGKVAQDFHAVLRDPMSLEAYTWLRVPTLVLRGGVSPAPARRVASLLTTALPDATLVTLREAGHMLPLTHRDTVGAAIAAHLDDNAGLGRQAA